MQMFKTAVVVCAGSWEHVAGSAELARSDQVLVKSKGLEWSGVEGETPVDVSWSLLCVFPSSA